MADKPRSRKKKSSKKAKSAPRKLKPAAGSPETLKPAAATSQPAASEAAGPIAALIAQILSKQAATLPPPLKPLLPGNVGAEIPIDRSAFQNLVASVATQNKQATQVWVKDSCEVLVFSGRVALTLGDGLVLVTVPVSCDQSGAASIQIPFAVGSKDQPAGLVFATEDRPRGPDVIVDVWGEALTAFAWQLLMAALTRVAAQSGVDADGAGLIPIAFAAAPTGVTLVPMARHTFDRVPR